MEKFMTCPINDGTDRDSGCIPNWSISTWVYKDYPGAAMDEQNGIFNQDSWLSDVSAAIQKYNTNQASPTSRISQTYPYATDLELPWVSSSYAGNNIPNESTTSVLTKLDLIETQVLDILKSKPAPPGSDPLPILSSPPIPTNDAGGPATFWSLSDPTKTTCEYGFNFVGTTSSNTNTFPTIPEQTAGVTTAPPTSLTKMSSLIPQTAIVIDGRIDNGYLQGFNEYLSISNNDPQNLASLIVNGGYSQNKAASIYQVGVGVFSPTSTNPYKPVIHGIQLDLEPFNSSNANQQAFYNKIGDLLSETNQYYSIFTFPKAMNQMTADLLNGTTNGNPPSAGNPRKNGYMIVPLYDLLDMKNGIPDVCMQDYTNATSICDTSAAPPPASATGDATTLTYDPNVPHSLVGYYNAALLTVKQTIALSKKYDIKYKFGIPMTSSVHEFENWGQYICQFNDFIKAKPINGFCRMYNGLPLNPNSGNPSQIGYLQQALRAIYDGINGMISDPNSPYDSTLFKGIDLYSFGFRTIWSPQNPIIDYNTGNTFYGNTSVYVPSDADGYPRGSLLNPPYVYTVPAFPHLYDDSGNVTLTNSILGWLSTVTLDVRPCGTTGGTYCPGSGQTCSNNVCS